MPGAKIPERVFDKIKECHFFVARMADYEDSSDGPENFLYCVSAFLSAFRTVAYRLYGVTTVQRGKDAQIVLHKQLHDHPLIGFLIGKSNVEIHEDGVTVWQRNAINVGDSGWRGAARWGRESDRWSSRFKSRFSTEMSVTAMHWQFEGSQSNLIELCRDALIEMENVVRQNVTLTQQVP